MKSFMVHVMREDYVTVEAENEKDAEQKAIESFVSYNASDECSATVLSQETHIIDDGIY